MAPEIGDPQGPVAASPRYQVHEVLVSPPSGSSMVAVSSVSSAAGSGSMVTDPASSRLLTETTRVSLVDAPPGSATLKPTVMVGVVSWSSCTLVRSWACVPPLLRTSSKLAALAGSMVNVRGVAPSGSTAVMVTMFWPGAAFSSTLPSAAEVMVGGSVSESLLTFTV